MKKSTTFNCKLPYFNYITNQIQKFVFRPNVKEENYEHAINLYEFLVFKSYKLSEKRNIRYK